MRPAELARELGISGKSLRGWLRRTYPRPPSAHGTDWHLTDEQIGAAREEWGGGRSSVPRSTAPKPVRGASTTVRADSDEAYVLDLCDEILGETSHRQHRFSWLLGDPGKSGRRVELPVDAYYPEHQLVIEYRERQHFESTPHFDKPDVMTVSGVHRGEQRRIYDERREREIPRHGLRLVVITPFELDHDSRGRLRRNRVSDLRCLRGLLDA